MSLNTNQKGAIAEAHTIYHATKRGYQVSIPSRDGPYDLIIEREDGMKRVQVKYVTPRKDVLTVSFSPSGWGRYDPGYSQETIDAIVFYDSVNEKSYWIDVKDKNESSLSLRLKPSKNNQKKGIKMAEDYRW